MTNAKKIEEIVEVADEVLNEWEREFLTSMSEKKDPEDLSEKQQKSLDRIYQKVCDSPY